MSRTDFQVATSTDGFVAWHHLNIGILTLYVKNTIPNWRNCFGIHKELPKHLNLHTWKSQYNHSIIRKWFYFVDLTTFYFLGQKFVKFFIVSFRKFKTPKKHSEINWPLAEHLNSTWTWGTKVCSDIKETTFWVGHFTTISGYSIAKYINILHKTEVLKVILRCLMSLNLNWIKSYGIKNNFFWQLCFSTFEEKNWKFKFRKLPFLDHCNSGIFLTTT